MKLLNFFENIKERRQINAILDKVERNQNAKDLVNKALSFRELREHTTALKILEDVQKKYPHYHPATLVYGNTLAMAGYIDEAIQYFNNILKSISKNERNMHNVREIYASLGSIYYFKKNNTKESMENYLHAIQSPDCVNISKEDNDFILSNVYKDLALICFIKKHYAMAAKHSRTRLSIYNKCFFAKKIFGLSIVNFLIEKDAFVPYVSESKEYSLLLNAIDYLIECYENDEEDYEVCSGLVIGCFLLSVMPFYANSKYKNSILHDYSNYFDSMASDAESGVKDAQTSYNMCNNIMQNIIQKKLEHLNPNKKFIVEMNS